MTINIDDKQFEPQPSEITSFFDKKHGHMTALLELMILLICFGFFGAGVSIYKEGMQPNIPFMLILGGVIFVLGTCTLWFGHKANEKKRIRQDKYQQHLLQLNEDELIEHHRLQEHAPSKDILTNYLNTHYEGWNETRKIVRRRQK